MLQLLRGAFIVGVALVVTAFIFLFNPLTSKADAATRYWVGGGSSSNWNATGNTNWGTASNTQDNASVPTSSDDVIFDGVGTGASNSTLSSSITVRSVNFTGYANTLTHSAGATLSIGDATAGASNIALKLSSGMTYTLGSSTTSAISFITTSATTQTVDFAGKTTGNVTYNATSNGSWQMTGTHNTGSTATVTLTKGTLNVNGQTASWGLFDSSNSNTRALTLGAAAITLTGTGTCWNLGTITGLTLSAASSTITCSGAGISFTGGTSLSYGTVNLTGSGTATLNSTGTTFVNLNRTGTAVTTDILTINGAKTVTGVLTLAGNSATNRLLVRTNGIGTQQTITNTGATMTWSNVDFMDIALSTSYDASAITGNSGDAGGNSNITFTTSSTQTWSGTSGGNWSANAWTTRVPLPQDDVVFNTAFTAGQTVTSNMPRLGRSINWTGTTGNPTWSETPSTATMYGSLTLVSGINRSGWASALSFGGRSSYTLTTAGVTMPGVTLVAPGGTLTLQDNLTANGALTVTNGTFDANNKNVTSTTFASTGTATRAVTMGTGTWTLTDTTATTVWNAVSTALTFSGASSTIAITGSSANTKTFAGGGLTYGTLTYTVAGSTGTLVISGSNTFNTINFSDASNARTLQFTAGTTTTIGSTFNVNGTSGRLMTINSSSGGSAATLSKSSGTVSVDYVSIQDSTAGGGASWYAGSNSTSVSGNSGWIFTSAPPSASSLGPTAYVNGSFGTTNQPNLTFSITDTDSSDTVKYHIQIDDSSDFSSPVVDYTSALAAQGSTNFTVGQVAGSGSYTTGSSGQTLSDGSYYWRVLGIDSHTVTGSYTTANSGAIAFKIDTGNPTDPGTPSTTTPTNSTSQSWIWSAATDAISGIANYLWRTTGTTIVSGSTTTADVVTSLGEGIYTFFVKAVDNAGNQSNESSGSLTVDTTAPTTPGTPTTTSPTTNTTPTWSWTASTDGGSGLATNAYTMQWSQDSGFSSGITMSTSTTNSFTHSTALTAGTWYFRVRATDNATNNSSYSSNGSVVITASTSGDTTSPVDLELDAPGNNAYTNNDRQTFRWRAATDSDSGLAKYVLEIDNPSLGASAPSGDFTIDSIPSYRTSDYETNRYLIHYENFADLDATNNYISVYTKSSTDWNASENDGKLREGKVQWTVKAVDNAGNEISSSRTLFVDRTNPTVQFTQINDRPLVLSDKELRFSTTRKRPVIFGKITDSLAGGDESLVQNENGPRVASGPKQVIVKVEKKNGLFYTLITLSTINMDKPYWSCTDSEILDNTKQICNKYLPFKFVPAENLSLGTYRVTIVGKDKSDNDSSEQTLFLTISTLSQIITPQEKVIIDKEIDNLKPEEQEKIKQELDITKPEELAKPNNVSFFGSIRQCIDIVVQRIGSEMAFTSSKIIKGVMIETQNVISNASFALGEKTEEVSTGIGNSIIEFGYLFISEPTTISNVKVARATPTSMTITWSTNHPATTKVNYGLTEDYGEDKQSTKRVTKHEVVVTGLKPNTTYYYEVMSQNQNYVYDANHTFTTPSH